MLTLGVRVGEYIQIGDGIKVTVVKSKNESLRLRIDAPREVEIYRGDVIEKQLKEGKRVREIKSL